VKTYYIESLGCAKNQVDSEHIMAELEADGYVRAGNPGDAGLIVINTCAFIESAKRESIATIMTFRRQYPDKKISVRGCLAERYRRELAESLPEADELRGVPSGIEESGSGTRPLLSLPGSAYVKISEGCDNRCAFCAIPLIRGRLRSRSPAAITAECRELLGRGIKELVLIAQDAGSYGIDGAASEDGEIRLPALLRAIASAGGNGKDDGSDGGKPAFWVRLLYMHPDRLLDTDSADSLLENLVRVMRDYPSILPYFDLPFQHASERILRAMGRRGNRDSYLRIIERLRGDFPHAVIRSTFLTGFPGETDADFAELLDFQREARIDWLGVFTYSREEGTPAYAMRERVHKKTAAARKAAIEEAQVPITAARLETFTGMETEALIEEEVEADDGAPGPRLYIGRLPLHAPEVDGAAVIASGTPLQPGAFVLVRTLGVSGVDMRCAALAPR
jgi:ribosomal protein S12 methylthiotransferase